MGDSPSSRDLLASGTEDDPPKTPPPRRRVARILVVDDDSLVREALKRCFRDHEVLVAADGTEALALFARGERFDAILCDLMMPEMRGDELFAEVHRLAPDQAGRFVFITGGARSAEAREFLENVPNPVVEKPFSASDLRDLVFAGLLKHV